MTEPARFVVEDHPLEMVGINKVLQPPITANLVLSQREATWLGIDPREVFASITLRDSTTKYKLLDDTLQGTISVPTKGRLFSSRSWGADDPEIQITLYFEWDDLCIAEPGIYYIRIRLYKGDANNMATAQRMDLYVDTEDIVVYAESPRTPHSIYITVSW
jgi:hypothetical protein